MHIANLWSGRGKNPVLVTGADGEPWLIYYQAQGFTGTITARNAVDGTTINVSKPGVDSADLAAVGATVVWNELIHGAYQLFESDLSGGDPRQLTSGFASAVHPGLAAAADGTLWLVYQTCDDDGLFNVYLRRKVGGDWAPPQKISDTPGNNWCPDVTCTTDGRAAVAWDGYASGSYDVYLRFIQPDGAPGATMRLTDDDLFHAHVRLAPAPDGAVWAAWNSGTAHWGKDNEVYRDTRIPERDYLHTRRRLELRRVFPGRAMPVFPPIQDALDPHLPGMLHERPRLSSPPGGPLYVAFRFNEGEPRGGHRNEKRWQAMVTCYDGRDWSEPVELPDAYGLSTGGISVTESADGKLLAAAAGEGGERGTVDLETSTFLYELEPMAGELTIVDPPVAGAVHPLPACAQRPKRHAIGHNGEVLNLYFGDVHRHTEFSFCRTSVDGSLEEAYRQTKDAAAMDFAMTADHDSQERAPDMWAETMRAADRFYAPGHYTTFFGYEWIGARDNRRHRNIVSTIRPPVPSFDATDGHRHVQGLWAGLERGKAITIPHHSACGMSLVWLKDPGEAVDADMEPLVEIFQASRTSSEYPGCPVLCNAFFWNGYVRSFNVEGGFVSDALRRGIRMGFIASSDHMSTHRSYACVYAPENTRDALMEAMRARHTYAATDRIVCEFAIGGAIMGEETALSSPAGVRIRFIGTGPIREVALLRDSAPYRTWQPETNDAELTTRLTPAEARGHYFYARMIQHDTNMAWSSPIWID